MLFRRQHDLAFRALFHMWTLLLSGKSQARCAIPPLPSLVYNMEGRGTLSVPWIPSQEWVSVGGSARHLEIFTSQTQILLLITFGDPAGQHGTHLPRRLRVGSIQQQSCYIFLLLRTVLLKVMQTSFLSLWLPELPGLHGATRFLGSRTFSTKTRIVLGTPRRLVTLLVEIT